MASTAMITAQDESPEQPSPDTPKVERSESQNNLLVSILYHVGPRGMAYLSDLIYHTDVLVQLVSILYHVGPRGLGYLSDLMYHPDVLVQLVSVLYHVGPRGMGYLSDLIYHTDVLVQLVSILYYKLYENICMIDTIRKVTHSSRSNMI
jgi:hypothetical protein